MSLMPLPSGGNISRAPMVGMSHRFTVLIDNANYTFGDWSKVTGLSVQWGQIEYRVGDRGNQVWYFPGTTKYEPITLSRAAGPYSWNVQQWLTQTSMSPQPQSGVVQLVDYTGTPIIQWRLNEFFPIAWSVEQFDAAGAKPAIETLKLAHTGFLPDEMNSSDESPDLPPILPF